MKKILFLFLLCIMTFCFTKCEKPIDGVRCDNTNTNRIGAVCNDGTTSSATGSGACSHHGGVEYWLCN